MYSLKDKKKAVDLLIKYDYAYTQVMRELGYPNIRTTLTKWNKELKETGKLNVRYQRRSRYSDNEKIDAVNHYLEHGRNISGTIRQIGYPNRVLLGKWIDEISSLSSIIRFGTLINKTFILFKHALIPNAVA